MDKKSKKFLKDQYLAEGSCGYTPDGKPRSKPASPDLMKEFSELDDSYYIDEIKRDLEELDDKEANKYLEDLAKSILKLKR